MNKGRTKQLTEPRELPSKEIDNLANALNAANEAMRLYFRSCGVAIGGNYFTLKELDRKQRTKLMKAAQNYHRDFMRSIPELVARKTKGKVQ